MSNVPEQLLEYLRGEESDGRGVFKAWADWVEAQINIAEATQPAHQERMTYSHEELAGSIDPIWIKYAALTQPASPPQTPADSQEPPAQGSHGST